MKSLCVGIALCVALGFAGSASAASIVYDVNMNFDPTHGEGGPGVGTITGTFTVDTSALKLTSIDLTESTNTTDTIGGAFGSPTFTSLNFGDSSLSNVQAGQKSDAFDGNPFLFISIQSSCCFIDGIPVGPSFQFDFPTLGGAVQSGNFDSVTSENRFLFGTVTPAMSAAPEPSNWALMIVGMGLLGTGLRFARRRDWAMTDAQV